MGTSCGCYSGLVMSIKDSPIEAVITATTALPADTNDMLERISSSSDESHQFAPTPSEMLGFPSPAIRFISSQSDLGSVGE